ncbi:DHH family phosphoesterase [Lacticaseibacillus zeae]|uniref:Bifunctional oligoribonuclease/PAP phosphatase NrnA n=1 Tax=Lacticaseibacillus zeae subsp. silagei TaxID=3068307 RepID=A0ABD7Z8W5_LACZE|nr:MULTISPECIES: bifunctional oligoribonuclease/PAP phosphatase NrnA [Lacticaseibacillus]MDE3316675.1 bifunctional oligoribonuclease/PAP phosphatase NrnA [Lacticaseibacillus zeae]OFR97171.1 exopolyphosphatase [Lactobacillus sp. HMSC068F07]WLV83467.1 bifunctional oligoribonuclease/PAP phosphatase NrnA [Lacticaseibacillus sp. NCIMB 15475]WLV86215.1 bifunctional oligoribonuclease/PAP phosphatase NrnA [Lacticaseibacillus sp. NCIMB 15474]
MSAEIEHILAAFDQFDTIIIHRHINPDPDAIGSQTGLALLLRAAYPQKTVYTAGPAAPDLAWIGPQQDVPAAAYKDALVVVIDTANRSRIAGTHFDQGAMLIKIDHHLNEDQLGAISWVDTNASSASEMVWELVQHSQRLTLNQPAAAALYTGMIGDTGRFLYDLTTARTHLAAADLLATGIDAPAIGRREDQFPEKVGRLIGWALEHVKITANGAGSLLITQKVLQQFDLAYGEEQRAVGNIGKLASIDRWVVFTERQDGKYRVELRGKTKEINTLAVRHGGGGHPLASGAVADNFAEVQAITQELAQQ